MTQLFAETFRMTTTTASRPPAPEPWNAVATSAPAGQPTDADGEPTDADGDAALRGAGGEAFALDCAVLPGCVVAPERAALPDCVVTGVVEDPAAVAVGSADGPEEPKWPEKAKVAATRAAPTTSAPEAISTWRLAKAIPAVPFEQSIEPCRHVAGPGSAAPLCSGRLRLYRRVGLLQQATGSGS